MGHISFRDETISVSCVSQWKAPLIMSVSCGEKFLRTCTREDLVFNKYESQECEFPHLKCGISRKIASFKDIHYLNVIFCANTFIQKLETILLWSKFVLFACGGIDSKANALFLWKVTQTRLLKRDGPLRVAINISERSVTLRNQSLDVFSLVASRQHLWSSGQSSWLLIQTSGFDSR
jgi:hypothetical protein